MTSFECEADFTGSAKGERAMGDCEGEMMFVGPHDELKESMRKCLNSKALRFPKHPVFPKKPRAFQV